MLEKYGIEDYDPLIALAELAQDAEEDGIKQKCLGEIANYVHPKRKSVELTGPEGGPLQMEHQLEIGNQLSELRKQLQKKLKAGK